jgi:hypothetical protein
MSSGGKGGVHLSAARSSHCSEQVQQVKLLEKFETTEAEAGDFP